MNSVRNELHIHRNLRNKFKLQDSLFSHNGRLRFPDFASVRVLSSLLNKTLPAEQHIYPGTLYASGLLQQTQHLLIRSFEKKMGLGLYANVEKTLTNHSKQKALVDYIEAFPPSAVYQNMLSAKELIFHSIKEKQTSTILEEAALLALANENPANSLLMPVFGIKHLNHPKDFRQFANNTLYPVLENAIIPGIEEPSLLQMLRAPFIFSPHSLEGQLAYILEHWKDHLPNELTRQILMGRDLIREDQNNAPSGFGPPPMVPPNYEGKGTRGVVKLGKSGYDPMEDLASEGEGEARFTRDSHWMPRVVMVAKNIHVWLDQLSKKYQRPISTLDQIPDEELDLLAQWNFNALWLIGVWERSRASQKIKHLMGKTDAVASAYSLHDYEIASDLGGETAYHNLNHRAMSRGIRLAGDMVPNHTGVVSRWVIDHPDYYIQTTKPPFPGYSFNGENLSDHPHIEVRLEDGYFSQSDAAVVFQRIDNRTGEVRYLYHGNDGTMMPWNDTAQLDMIRETVREAVMGKIIEVAGRFSIIRFDAAMTLAKKHFSRLWYPRPGSGGDIPSRAEHAMTKKEFDKLFPEEFWREVVDRMGREKPDTLLLAEAFWFMEGYFVRTLGMHRVYNSAFMHMLKNQENDKYRELIANTLAYDPEILQRYVNFMSNPDEETAIEQFGTGDKYIGVCVMMITLPGLPMFAHGQVEGYTEKYGMEYRRAYYNEQPNNYLVEKHEQLIFPLTAMRHLFSEVKNFNFFGFTCDIGGICENVFAYTNRYDNERVLVLYNNAYETVTGHIKVSVPKRSPRASSGETRAISLAEALELADGVGQFLMARDHIQGLEYLFSVDEIIETGLGCTLNGYACRVWTDFETLADEDGSLGSFYEEIKGRGLTDIQKAFQAFRLRDVHGAFMDVLLPASYSQSDKNHWPEQATRPPLDGQLLTGPFMEFVSQASKHMTRPPDQERALALFESMQDIIIEANGDHGLENRLLLNAFIALNAFFKASSLKGKDLLETFQQLHFDEPMRVAMETTGKNASDTDCYLVLLKILLRHGDELYLFNNFVAYADSARATLSSSTIAEKAKKALEVLSDPMVKQYLGVNQYKGIWYYSKERFELLNRWFFTIAIHKQPGSEKEGFPLETTSHMKPGIRFFILARQISDHSAYQMNKLVIKLQQLADNG